jgi:hypothetical protein
MNTTPFIYGNTVNNKAFTDRETDSAKSYSILIVGIIPNTNNILYNK